MLTDHSDSFRLLRRKRADTAGSRIGSWNPSGEKYEVRYETRRTATVSTPQTGEPTRMRICSAPPPPLHLPLTYKSTTPACNNPSNHNNKKKQQQRQRGRTVDVHKPEQEHRTPSSSEANASDSRSLSPVSSSGSRDLSCFPCARQRQQWRRRRRGWRGWFCSWCC
jgi:hypothetical protein